MVTFEGYSNINEVLKYKGKNIYINKDDITLGQEEYLDEDIIGMTVIYKDAEKGKVSAIERYVKNTLLKIDTNNKYYLIPYNYNLIDKVDISSGKIYIKNIDGLFD